MGRRRYAIIGMLAALAVPVGACGNPSATTSTPSTGGTLTIDNESGTLWSCGFNPFNGNVNFLAFGPIYEPLVYVNLLNGKPTPMLASSFKWSSDNKTLTFTARSGVKWSDGQPFTAKDVAYTFNLIKTNTALDLQSVWSVLSDVKQEGSDKVVMTFQSIVLIRRRPPEARRTRNSGSRRRRSKASASASESCCGTCSPVAPSRTTSTCRKCGMNCGCSSWRQRTSSSSIATS